LLTIPVREHGDVLELFPLCKLFLYFLAPDERLVAAALGTGLLKVGNNLLGLQEVRDASIDQ
jgi:hypothetical protein